MKCVMKGMYNADYNESEVRRVLMNSSEYISIEESRNRLLSSNACKCLYDFDSELWKEGPDYFLDYYRRSEKNLRCK